MSVRGRSEALTPQREARRLNDFTAGPLPRRSALQAARSRDATALRTVQADAGRLGAAALSTLGGTGAQRRRGHT
jgi:hypothetical protein